MGMGLPNHTPMNFLPSGMQLPAQKVAVSLFCFPMRRVEPSVIKGCATHRQSFTLYRQSCRQGRLDNVKTKSRQIVCVDHDSLISRLSLILLKLFAGRSTIQVVLGSKANNAVNWHCLMLFVNLALTEVLRSWLLCCYCKYLLFRFHNGWFRTNPTIADSNCEMRSTFLAHKIQFVIRQICIAIILLFTHWTDNWDTF